jgi:hypothetical protein
MESGGLSPGGWLGDRRRALGSPRYRPTLWLVTARPVGKLNAFLDETAAPRGHLSLAALAYQPDCRQFCAKGLRCKRISDKEHCGHYQHVDKAELNAAAAAQQSSQLLNPRPLVAPPAAALSLPFVQRCWALWNVEHEGTIHRVDPKFAS